MNKNRETIETYVLLTVAAFLMSLGVVWIFNSEQIVPGGVTGIGIIIENLTENMGTGIPVWLTNLVINVPLFIWGYFLLDRKSMIRTAYTTVISTAFLAVIPALPLATHDRLLNMILGGVIFGCAYGLDIESYEKRYWCAVIPWGYRHSDRNSRRNCIWPGKYAVCCYCNRNINKIIRYDRTGNQTWKTGLHYFFQMR